MTIQCIHSTVYSNHIQTDYTQIVDDLRTLKNKYNNFKVDHAQTETKLKHLQREAMDYER